jgi:hypothetical protein
MRTRRIMSRIRSAALEVSRETSRLIWYLWVRGSSHLLTGIQRLGDVSGVPAQGRWRDLVAIAIFAAIKAYLLGSLGAYDWHGNDGVGYVALAEQLQRWATWVSVPDLASKLMPISLLRIPGYSLLIVAAQAAVGDGWFAALIAIQLSASLFATFVLYRAIWSFSGFWFIGVLGAAWFATSYVGFFERIILSDSLTISLFTVLLSCVSLAAFRCRLLSPVGAASIATAFPILFLLREANILMAFTLVPLVFLALPRERRLARLATVYAPLVAMFLLVGLWQQSRTGYFLVTTGGQASPIGAVALVDKISPVLDQNSAVDLAVRSITDTMTQAEIEKEPWPVIYKINERLAADLNIRAPELARLILGRYISVWLNHPAEMAAYVGRNQAIVRIAGVSPFIYDDVRLAAHTRDLYSYYSQQVVQWGLIKLPVLWLFIVIIAAPLRRTALIVLALWLFAITVVAFHSAIYLETRYVLPTLGPILLVIALTIGSANRMLFMTLMFIRHKLIPVRSRPSG